MRELADGIITTQREEIAQMKWLMDDIEGNGVASSEEEAGQRPVPQNPTTP